MQRWSHPRSQVRRALGEADSAGLKVVPTKAHGHSWGYIDCPNCEGRFWVWSTPRNADDHASDIRRFIHKHRHPDGRKQAAPG
jgi:hypothetical protein